MVYLVNICTDAGMWNAHRALKPRDEFSAAGGALRGRL